jgi:hypothetical protein
VNKDAALAEFQKVAGMFPVFSLAQKTSLTSPVFSGSGASGDRAAS